MSTSLSTDLQTDWQQWHAAREQELATPHGWLSLTGFHWLPEVPSTLPGLSGTYAVQDGQAVLTARADAGYQVAREGTGELEPVDGTVRAQVAEAKSLHWLTLGEVIVELALRGGRYAIRTRDPQAKARRLFTGVPGFAVDEKWILTGSFEPFDAPRSITVSTARDDLEQQITGVGTVFVEHEGRSYPLVAAAGAAGTLNVAFHDSTNGGQTARWRAVSTTAPNDDGRLEIDFNRSVNFPFAFSAYGTCPAPVTGNVLPFPVTAGELAPTVVAS